MTAPPLALRLGVNVDHVATLRNTRDGDIPDPVRAAITAVQAGADGITAHLREDRRHIRDDDIRRLKTEVPAPLNLEMAATDEMVAIALETAPHACCLVPERRDEKTTEGGLNVIAGARQLQRSVEKLSAAGIRVSLFIDPDVDQIMAAADIGAPVVELHTGSYCDAHTSVTARSELSKIGDGAKAAHSLGLEVHAGHGLTFETVGPVAAMPQITELNIGHFLVGEAVFLGLGGAVTEMRRRMTAARDGVLLA